MDPKRTGQVISTARKNNNLTQKDLADKLFVTDKAVSKWERGICFPDISVLIPLTEVLNINLYDLLRGENKMNKKEVEETLKNTIDYSNKEIKKNKRRILKISIISIILIIIVSSIVNVSISKNKEEKLLKQIVANDKMPKITEYVDYKTSLKSKKKTKLYKIIGNLSLKYTDWTTEESGNKIEFIYYTTNKDLSKLYKDSYVKKSMIHSALVLYTTVSDIDKVTYKFKDVTYSTTKKQVKDKLKIDNFEDLEKLDKWDTLKDNYYSNESQINDTFSKLYTKTK
ncbi:MAG: helix-turn-helix transcriptional regulator [Bacilli bacterium]|nr:helix-turn-helix transcriptional regulator [Bacilli bacterium]